MQVDTDSAALAAQVHVQGTLSGEQRLLTALEMSLFARELMKASIRKEHPDWGEREVALELIRLAFLPEEPPCLR